MKSVVLLSGGLDSATCLGLAVKKFGYENVSAVSVFYGQRHERELECAKKISAYYKVSRYEFDAAKIMSYSSSALLNTSTENLEKNSYGEQVKKNPRISTYVPFRNGLMLSIAASFADGLYNGEDTEIFIGVHQDASAINVYPDCSENFIRAISEAVEIGTYGKIKIVAPFAGKTKADIVKVGLELKVPYEITWSCYERGEIPCGKCATCIDRKKAFELNGVKDPASELRIKN